MPKSCAVIQFPGSNCEYETLEALSLVGIKADILRWNCTEKEFFDYSAFIIPGGFSFQDRVRAGVVASKLPIMSYLSKSAEEGVPILGICNGCQILAETGLVTNIKDEKKMEIALAPNMKEGQLHGFVCDWVYVKIKNPEKNIFTKVFNPEEVIPIPINHGEGNFKCMASVKSKIEEVTHIQYCNENGDVLSDYPVNPNGSFNNLAGVSNPKGNVLAMMPHPERASFLRQVPYYINHNWSQKKRKKLNDNYQEKGPWASFFQSLTYFLET